MKYFVVAARDRKAQVFGQPSVVPNVAAAIRSFQDQCKDPDGGIMAKHPEDFDLYLLGNYDDEVGTFDGGPPVQVAAGDAV